LDESPWSILKKSLRDLRRTWPQVVLTDLLSRVLAVVIIAPLVSLLVRLFLWRTATGVLTDETIVSKIAAWLLSLPMVLFEGAGGRRALAASASSSG